MTQVTCKELRPGVSLTAVHTNKFKTCALGVSLLTPIREETAALNALVPAVLRRGTRGCPDMETLSAALDDLYGGSVEPMVRKKGETQCIGFVGSFLDDAFTPDGTPILESAATLLGNLLLNPAGDESGFRPDYVEGERANLIDRIRAQVNDKRQYALLRLTREMCAWEPYGVDKLGDEATAAAITGEALWTQYRTLLKTAQIELYYCGSADPDRVERALTAAFSALPEGDERAEPDCGVQDNATEEPPRFVAETLDVTQGKLALGFRTGGACIWEDSYPALLVLNAVYGGTPTSKLFLNVRERLSLCYFASSMLEKFKGLLLVSSGVEFEKFDAAKAEILAQLDACRGGQIEPWELEGGRRSVVSGLYTMMDGQSPLEEYWLGQAVAGLTEGPEELAARVESVTLEAVVAVAKSLELDTIYFLRGQEGGGV